MTRNPTSKAPKDRLTLAAFLLAGAAAFCLLAVSTLVGFVRLRPDAVAAAACRQVVRQYGLNTMALVPAGTGVRHSDGHMPNVDLRYDPRLPISSSNVERVFLPQPARYFPAVPSQERPQTESNTIE